MSWDLGYALAASAVLLTALFCYLWPANSFSIRWRICCLVGFLLLLLIPVNGIPTLYYIRGVIGEPSISSTLIFFLSILRGSLPKAFPRYGEWRVFAGMVLLGALFLYPSTFGLSSFDSYAAGFYPLYLLTFIFLAGLFFWYQGYHLLAILLATDVLCYGLKVLESRNLWDYLLDPVLVLVIVLFWLRVGYAKILERTGEYR